MPNVNLAPYDPQQQAIDRRRALAQALQQQSFEPIEAPPIPGALTSPLQGVSKLVQAIMSGYANRRLDKEQKAVNERIQGQNTGQANSLVAALMGAAPQQSDQAAPPQMPLQLPQDSQTIGAPPPDTGAWDAKRQALAAAMVSPNPALAKGGEAGIADVLAGKREMEQQRAKMAEIQQGQQFTAGQNDLTRNLEQQRISDARANYLSEAQHRTDQEKVAAELANKPKPMITPAGGRIDIVGPDGTVTPGPLGPPKEETPDDMTRYVDAQEKLKGSPLTPKERSAAMEKWHTMAGTNTFNLQQAAADTAPTIKRDTPDYRIAEQLADGRLTLSAFQRLYSTRSNAAALKRSVYDLAGQLNPTFDPAAFEQGYKFATNPKVQQQLASINNVVSGVPDLLKLSDAAQRSNVTLFNQFINKAGYKVGNKNFSNLATARTAFADELSGALGYGSATDMAREMGMNMTDPNLSPENFRSAIQEVVVPFIQRKKASLLGPMGIYSNLGGGGTGGGEAPKVGDIKTFPNGKKGRWDGTGWEPQ